MDPRRVELGYDYCLKEECQQRCLHRVKLAALGVNKAADYYMRADEVLPPPAPPAEPQPGPTPPSVDQPSVHQPSVHQPGVDELSVDGPGVDGPGVDGPGADGPGVDEPGRDRLRTPRPIDPRPRRARSTLERLREQEAELDEALDRTYQRFRLGEITAREMDAKRDRLVDAFNRQVRSENIRYRSFLRRSPHRGSAAR